MLLLNSPPPPPPPRSLPFSRKTNTFTYFSLTFSAAKRHKNGVEGGADGAVLRRAPVLSVAIRGLQRRSRLRIGEGGGGEPQARPIPDLRRDQRDVQTQIAGAGLLP